MKQIYKVGLPTIITQAIGSIMVTAVNAILMPYSSTAVAFFGVYYKLQNFLFMPMNGLGQAATCIFLVIPGPLLRIFSASEEMLELGVPALRIISLTFAFASVTMVLGYSISGIGNGVVNMMGTAIRQLILLVPVLYLFVKCAGIHYAWYAFWIAEVAAVVYAACATRKELLKKGLL